MLKKLSVFVVLFTLIVFSSCEKERGEAVACFDTGTAIFRAGNDVRLMNCSQNWDGSKWYIINGNNILDTLYIEPTDTLKHFVSSFVADTFDIHLVVWQRDSVSISSDFKQIIVLP